MGETILTCVYCGQVYPAGTPSHGASVLTEHIKVCEKHPMRKAEEAVNKLREALIGLVGARAEEELKAMEAAMRSVPGIERDKVVALNAVHALLDTMEWEV